MSENELNNFFRYQYYLNFITECISLTNPPNFDYNNLIPIIMDYYFLPSGEEENKSITMIECGGNCNYSLKDNCVVEFSTIFEAEECFVENLKYISESLQTHYKICVDRFKDRFNTTSNNDINSRKYVSIKSYKEEEDKISISKLDYTYLQILFLCYYPEKVSYFVGNSSYTGVFVQPTINNNMISWRSSVSIKRPIQYIFITSDHLIQKLHNLYIKYEEKYLMKDDFSSDEEEEENVDPLLKITTKIKKEDDEYIKKYKLNLASCREFMYDEEDEE
jgi:hypothetical protein